MRFSILVAICIAFLPTSLCETAIKGNILALILPMPSHQMVVKTLARELKEFGYKTTIVIPADDDVEKSMHDSGVNVIASEGMTQLYSVLLNMCIEIVKQGFTGNTGMITPLKVIEEFCPYLSEDFALIETLRRGKFDMAIIDILFVNLCVSVIPYKLSIPFIHYGRSIKLQEMRTLVHPGVYPATAALPFSDQMSYLQRVLNSLIYMKLMVFPDPLYLSDIVGTFAPEMPHITNQQLQA